MSGLGTPISWVLILGWGLLALLLLAIRHRSLQPALGYRSVWGLTLLRGASLVLVAVLLLQPYREQRRPDREAFRAVVLLDTSASMTVSDLSGGRPRLEAVRAAVAPGGASSPSLLERLDQTARLEARVFADRSRPMPSGVPVAVTPGRTALGEVLAEALEESAGPPLGAVLVLSDGCSNDGRAPTEVAKLFRSRGIPISCVGIGEHRQAGDLRVRFAAERYRGRKGEPLELAVLLENHFDHAVSTRLAVRDDQGVVAEREVSLAAGASVRETIAVTPWRAGFLSYSARVEPVDGDRQPDTDIDVAGAEISEPEHFEVLFLGAHLGWEYRFLRGLCEAHPQLRLAAVIQTGPASFYQTGLNGDDEGRLEGFPTSPEVFHRFDAVVLDGRAVGALGEAGAAALVGFVDRRGGGLLVVGPTADLPESLREVVPVLPAPAGALTRREYLEANPEFIFDVDPGQVLASPGSLPVPPGGPLWLSRELKRGARAAAVLRGSGLTALAAQSYGSGRVAYLGLESTWRWRLASAGGEASHSAFWNALLVWLASTGKPRLQVAADGSKVGLGEAVPLDVQVLGRDFLPAVDAQVTATVTSPSGASHEVALDASAEAPGRYTAVAFPEEVGEYRVAYRIRAPSSGDLDGEAHFLARRVGLETEDTAYREDVLRDLARVTGGTFVGYREMDRLEALPLSTAVPMRTARLYWSRHGVLMVLLAACLAAEWYWRRRLGLK